MPFNKSTIFKGKYFPPGDKSISHRILILTGQSIGKSTISNLLEGEDVINTLKAMSLLGAQIKKKDNKYIVFGLPPGALFQPNKKIDFGNSGTLARLLIGILSSTPGINIKIKGDHSLSKRNMAKLIKLMSEFGATFLPKNKI